MVVGRNNTNDWHLMYRECTRKAYSVCKQFEIKRNAVSYRITKARYEYPIKMGLTNVTP